MNQMINIVEGEIAAPPEICIAVRMLSKGKFYSFRTIPVLDGYIFVHEHYVIGSLDDLIVLSAQEAALVGVIYPVFQIRQTWFDILLKNFMVDNNIRWIINDDREYQIPRIFRSNLISKQSLGGAQYYYYSKSTTYEDLSNVPE